MAPWSTLPIVVPLGLGVMIIALAIYHAYLHPTRRLQAVAAKNSTGTNSPLEQVPRWRT